MKDILGQEIKVGGFLIYYDKFFKKYTAEYIIKVEKDYFTVILFEPSLNGYCEICYEEKDFIYINPIVCYLDSIDWNNKLFKPYKDLMPTND